NLSLFDQGQYCDAGDGFGLGRDTENRVHRHAATSLFVAPPDCSLVHRPPVTKHERHDASDTVLVDVLLQHPVDPRETVGGKGANRWRGGTRLCRYTDTATKGESQRDSESDSFHFFS